MTTRKKEADSNISSNSEANIDESLNIEKK